MLRRRGALVLACLLLAACAGTLPAEVSDAPTKDPLPPTVWVGPTDSLHPHVTSPHVTSALFSGLVTVDPQTRLPAWGPDAPGALMASLSTEDLRRWEIELKPEWRWHDGTVVEATDLARGWEAAIAAEEPIASTVSDIRVRDKLVLSFALSAPFGQLPMLLADPAFLPLPPMAAQDPARFREAPIGNGPYRLTGRAGEVLQLEAVSDHPSAPEQARWGISRAAEPVERDLVAVGVDGAAVPPAAEGRLTWVPGRQLAYLGLPLTESRYADVEVRAALSQAIDRDALVDQVLDRAVTPADRLLGPGMARAESVTCEACSFRPDQAVARWPDDFEGPLTVWFAADAGHEDVIDAVAESWRTVLGITDIQLATLPAVDLIDRLTANEVSGPFRLSWAADTPSPSRLLDPLFGPRGNANDFRYRDEQVEELLREADLERDLEVALQRYAMVEQAVLGDMPLIPLWFSAIPIVADLSVELVVDGMGRLDWARLTTG